MKKVLLLKQEGNSRLKWKSKHLLRRGLKEALAFASVVVFLLISASSFAQTRPVTGTVVDTTGEALIGVSVKEKGTNTGVGTDAKGRFNLNVSNANGTLVVSYVGYTTQEVAINGKTDLRIRLKSANSSLTEVVVTGYSAQKKESITSAISTVTAKDLDRVHAGSTVSATLAGKLPGVSFKMAEGRPGAGAAISIRNFGPALYVIDGIQQDEGQFNNLSPNDIESITVLKDASASIYGVRAANGVVVVTTKRGKLGAPSTINIDSYYSLQQWTRFPKTVNNSYDYMRFRAEAEINDRGTTSITPTELDKYKQGTLPGYQSFDWRDFVLNHKAPLSSININATGGSDKITYYLSGTRLDQSTQMGKEFKFNRTNIQSNIDAKITDRLKVGVQINGRIESTDNPGVPGTDDYFLARYAILRNTPLERPYANDNPAYLNDIKHNETNYAYLNLKDAGHYHNDWRILQTNFNADYQIPGVKGLTLRGKYSYYIGDRLLNNFEYTYKTYTYNPTDQSYAATGGSTNPWRERDQQKVINTTSQAILDYSNTFGKHSISAFFVAERLENDFLENYVHAVPTTNSLPLIYFPTTDTYNDTQNTTTRTGYATRLSYNYANRYYAEFSGRRDASSLFAPDKRVGYFPSGSVGWRITDEPVVKKLLGDHSFLTDLKFRASYGILGNDRNPNDANQPIVGLFAYLPGYNYNSGTNILGGNTIITSRDKGAPVTNVSWLRSKITDIGADYSLFGGKVTGAFDYFYRERSGLLQARYDVLVPSELGYTLPSENLGTDAVVGGETSIAYNNTAGKLTYSVGGNVGIARQKFISSYKPVFFNSLDQYFNSQEGRYTNITFGYEAIGQFTSQEQINNYKVNIDGQGNKTLLPGDLIYKDLNNDGRIDDSDRRPVGYQNGGAPIINFGFNFALNYKGFDFHADFSGAAGYSFVQNFETRWAFQNDGALNTIFEDRWHKADVYDVNSEWIPGKYPALRFNKGGHSDYNNNSTFWTHNVAYFRARTIELGYTLPKTLLSRINVKNTRVYANTYNLFSIDNLHQYSIDPEINDNNGLQHPQSRIFNVGIKLAL
jgi:TonB-linked SusC/RagA family outer membrane protein